MSSFTMKKPRAIRTLDDDEPEEDPSESVKEVSVPLKFGKRSIKQSSLRKSVNAEDAAALSFEPLENNAGDGGPVVIRSSLSRAGSTKKNKRLSSRLSFGDTLGDPAGGDGSQEVDAFVTPKKTSLSAKVLENSALRSLLPLGLDNNDSGRPRYSKEYLEELASSTPNTPRDLSNLKISSDDELDELEAAVVFPNSELAPTWGKPPTVLTDAEIRERKERRARMARNQEEFISLDASATRDDDPDTKVYTLERRKESRLIAEDDGDAYEDFVEDGGLSLGRKAEREARRRQRAAMAELIDAAEEDGSSDSEAERRAAYEAAQTKAGMDGLSRHDGDDEGSGHGGILAIPRMKPLPELTDCLARMRDILQARENDARSKKSNIADLEREKKEILEREKEVQAILDQAGKKYQAAMGTTGLPTQSPLRPLQFGGERGLESLGGTPERYTDK